MMKICMEINWIELAYNAFIRDRWYSIYDDGDDAECYNTAFALAAELVFDQWNPGDTQPSPRCFECREACRDCSMFYDAVETRIKKDVQREREIHVTD